MATPFLNDKQSTQDIKKFIKMPQEPKTQGKQPEGRKGQVGSPANRTLPIRSL
jgi:hypothetical protein